MLIAVGYLTEQARIAKDFLLTSAVSLVQGLTLCLEARTLLSSGKVDVRADIRLDHGKHHRGRCIIFNEKLEEGSYNCLRSPGQL
ncbi:hypothetical protein U0070_003727 [Myodes glareolus]|uniref:Uncharacterized protein n=1 Tax=Myodes glareolus TaxID=447135 RepID=A0AAW0J566_MYOGA